MSPHLWPRYGHDCEQENFFFPDKLQGFKTHIPVKKKSFHFLSPVHQIDLLSLLNFNTKKKFFQLLLLIIIEDKTRVKGNT